MYRYEFIRYETRRYIVQVDIPTIDEAQAHCIASIGPVKHLMEKENVGAVTEIESEYSCMLWTHPTKIEE